MNLLDMTIDLLDGSSLIMSVDGEARATHFFSNTSKKGIKLENAIIFTYEREYSELTKQFLEEIRELSNGEILTISFPISQIDFVDALKKSSKISSSKKIVIDISTVITPYLFLLLKYLHVCNPTSEIIIVNTIPHDYNYNQTPFISYKSSSGNLRTEEIIGFSGINGAHQSNDLYILIGFESSLALKVEDDSSYNRLFIVNTLPSYYQKYKDISSISNYQLLAPNNHNMLYAPAINPFEVYNILEKQIEKGKGITIAPLCTKPIALGVCMYALKNPNIRVVYPFSDSYDFNRTHDVYTSYVYRLTLEG